MKHFVYGVLSFLIPFALIYLAKGALASDTTYAVRSYTHNGDGSGQAMASLGSDAAHMYRYKRDEDGITRFCLEDAFVELCFTTEDRFNPDTKEHQYLDFALVQ